MKEKQRKQKRLLNLQKNKITSRLKFKYRTRETYEWIIEWLNGYLRKGTKCQKKFKKNHRKTQKV